MVKRRFRVSLAAAAPTARIRIAGMPSPAVRPPSAGPIGTDCGSPSQVAGRVARGAEAADPVAGPCPLPDPARSGAPRPHHLCCGLLRARRTRTARLRPVPRRTRSPNGSGIARRVPGVARRAGRAQARQLSPRPLVVRQRRAERWPGQRPMRLEPGHHNGLFTPVVPSLYEEDRCRRACPQGRRYGPCFAPLRGA